MKTLFCLEQSSLSITALYPMKPETPTLQQRRTWQLHAKAKGFSGASNKIQEKKIMPKETVPERSYQKPNGTDEDDDDDDKIPQVVLDRMIVRILAYVGVPLVTGMVILQGFSIVKEQNLVDIPVWLPFLTTFITFGASALGIAIGSLSASWDPDRKGSLLGFEEARRNWVEMWKEEDETYRR